MINLKGKIAVVTGASRGVGRGIALGLAEAGATVYVTGRTENGDSMPDFLKNTSIYQTVRQINEMGGVGIAYKCDHSRDGETEALFNEVVNKNGKVDILVNNAWGGGIHSMQSYFFNTPFWEQPVSIWDDHYVVGVRSNYVASRLAAKIMANQKEGIIINISFFGGKRYFNNVAYGVSKATVDRMSKDMAIELKDYNVRVFSLYPGQVSTEGMLEYAKYSEDLDISGMESPQFIGRCVAALANDRNIIKESGKILIAAEVAEKYGIKDIDGKQPKSLRSVLWD